MEKQVDILGHSITPDTVSKIIKKASLVKWGTHLLRWRYFDVIYDDVLYRRGILIPTGLWHLLKRIFVDQDWQDGATLESL